MGKSHDKTIVVKKRLAERVVFHCLGGSFVVGWIIVMITGETGDGLWTLWTAPLALIGLSIQLFFELWRITFTSKEIRIRRWPFREKIYAYSMIKEVTKGYSSAENDYVICCKFADGKDIAFRSKDVNAALAAKKLLSHRTIRNVSYW